MKILSISDQVIPTLHSPEIVDLVGDVDMIIGCGDLPYYYQEYIAKKLDAPLIFVRGNHDVLIEYDAYGDRNAPRGGIDLHRKVFIKDEIIFAGIEGCNRYNRGNFQYTPSEMWGHVFQLVPRLVFNRLVHGRALDVLVTHAAPFGIHDKPDWTHQGIKAFNWLIKTFKPKYHFHGHNHVYKVETATETQVGNTLVINTYGYKVRELEV